MCYFRRVVNAGLSSPLRARDFRTFIKTNNQANLELELFNFLASQKFETPRKICEKRIENICSSLKRETKQKAIKEALLAK